MLHENLYQEMNPDYKSRIFFARKTLLQSIESPTILPENGLSARGILSPSQMEKVRAIRQKRLAPVLNRFQPD